MSTETPEQIGPYTVISRLDRSGPEPVYKVEEIGGRTLAVKLYAADETDDLREFRRDVLAKAIRLRHPALVRYEAVGEHEGRVFTAMEFMPSTTLLQRPMPLHTTLRVIPQIAEGLGHLHAQGNIHGCLDPSRALVSLDGSTAKIIEPGMCTSTRPAAMTATATMQGAKMVRYLAPEMRHGSRAASDPRADIYSLGALFYEVLTGKVPLGRFRLPSQESDTVPPELDEVVLRCLREDPAARYRTTSELIEAIDRIHASLPGGLTRQLETLTSTARGALGGATHRRRGRLWASVVGLGAIAIVVAVLAVRACV